MNIFVCLSRTPDTASRIRVAPSGAGIDLEGLQFVINPFDEFAVEEAVRLKEKVGGTVTVLCVGAADAQKDLRSCLAKGADSAVLMTPTATTDSLGVAKLLAAKLKESKPDAVFCGKQAVDDDQAAVGPMVAALLGLACVSKAVSFAVSGGGFVATREVEGGVETVEGAFPAVITAEKGLNEPRRAGLKEIMAAKNKPLTQASVEPPKPRVTAVKLEPPPDRAPVKMVGEGKGATPKLIDALKNEAKVL